MRLLTYDEYISCGGVIPEREFERSVDRASAIVEYYAQNRISNDERYGNGDFPFIDDIHNCVRDIIEYLYSFQNIKKYITASSATVQSKTQSAGGVSESETYATDTRTVDEANAEIKNIVYDYLYHITDENGTPLLYRG